MDESLEVDDGDALPRVGDGRCTGQRFRRCLETDRARARPEDQAWQSKDVTALGAVLGDAFVYVDPKGKVLTKAEVLMHIETTDALQFGRTMTVRLHGKTAIVTGLYRMEGMEHGKPFVRRGRLVDAWLEKNGQWIAIASLLTPAGG
jgi:Domain of unknown function (DUF4440)